MFILIIAYKKECNGVVFMQKGQKMAISNVQSRHKFSEYFHPIDINIKTRFLLKYKMVLNRSLLRKEIYHA